MGDVCEEEFIYLSTGVTSEVDEGAEPGKLPFDEVHQREIDANLRAMSGELEPYVEERPDAPWWLGEDAMTLTFVLGAHPADVARVLGVDLAKAEPRKLAEASGEWDGDAMPLAITEVPGAVVVVEPNGYQCAMPDAVVALSRLGRTVALYWNVNFVSSFHVAEGGTLLRSFDPVLDQGEGEGAPFPEEAGIDWEGNPISRAAELQARLVGIALTRGEVFGAPLPTMTVSG